MSDIEEIEALMKLDGWKPNGRTWTHSIPDKCLAHYTSKEGVVGVVRKQSREIQKATVRELCDIFYGTDDDKRYWHDMQLMAMLLYEAPQLRRALLQAIEKMKRANE